MRPSSVSAGSEPGGGNLARREILKNLVTLPVLGAMVFGTFRLKGRYDIDVLSGATIQIGRASLAELTGTLPKGKIGTHEISRLVRDNKLDVIVKMMDKAVQEEMGGGVNLEDNVWYIPAPQALIPETENDL